MSDIKMDTELDTKNITLEAAEDSVENSAEDSKGELPSLDEVQEELFRERKKNRQSKVLRRTVYALIIVAAIAVILAVLVTPVLQISGSSMTETLQDGDIVVALKNSKFKKGEVVAFYYNNSILIKRVIATAGEWVNIDDEGNVYVNDVKLDEPYVSEKSLGDCNIELPYQVPDNKVFVLGDHRATSIDSRNTAVGCVDYDDILGKILFRVWPLTGLGTIG